MIRRSARISSRGAKPYDRHALPVASNLQRTLAPIQEEADQALLNPDQPAAETMDNLNTTMLHDEQHASTSAASDPPTQERVIMLLAQMSKQMENMNLQQQQLIAGQREDRKAVCELEKRVQSLQSMQPAAGSTTQSGSSSTQNNNTQTINSQAAAPVLARSDSQQSINNDADDGASQHSSIGSMNRNANTAAQQIPAINSAMFGNKAFDLPEFTGLPEEWRTFIAAFHQSTEAAGFTQLQNIFRLRRCLKGNARAAVEYQLADPENVDGLLETLRFQFGRPEILADSQTKKVLATPDINEKHIELIVEYSVKLQNMVSFLNTPECRDTLQERSLLKKLESKLPMSKRLEWIGLSKLMVPRATIIQFSAWLKNYAENVTLLGDQQSTPKTAAAAGAPVRTTSESAQSRGRPHQLLMTRTGRESCSACPGTHKITDCERFKNLDVADRWAAAKRHRLCFACLRAGHTFDVCRSKRQCPSNGCAFSHHPLLHSTPDERAADAEQPRDPEPIEPPPANNDEQPSPRPRNPFSQPSSAIYTCRERIEEEPILFRIIPVTLYGPTHYVDTFALIDDGSSLTLIEDDMANQLQLDGSRSSLSMQWIGGRSSSEESREVSLDISGVGPNSQRHGLQHVRTIRHLNLPMQTLTLSRDDPRHEHLRHLHVSEYQNAVPTILLGLDHSHLGVPMQTRASVCGGPIATRTPLGWVVYGRQAAGAKERSTTLHCVESDDAQVRLERLMRDYLSVENCGVATPNRIIESDEDTRARAILRSTTVRVGDRFEVGLLWRTEEIRLPNSYEMAHRRLMSVERKMRRDPDYAALYTRNIDSYITKGYARMLSDAEAAERGPRTWFLPHFGVQPANKPGKFRLVFDAAATVDNVSLNSALLKGPDLNQPLLAILFRFRMRRIGVCADIAEMFHQVEVRKEDRCAQRFLWGRRDDDNSPQQYEMLVMTFGASCSPTAAQFVKNHNADEHGAEFPAAAEAIRSSHYVDDFVCSFSCEEEAIRVTRDVVEVHKRGGFHLRGFVCNNRAVVEALDGAEIEGATHDMQLATNASDKILGMMWRTDEDAFTFAMRFDRVDPDVISGVRPPTKREILSAVMSVFDPFGFLADVILPAKVIVQDLWKAAVGWDEKVTQPIYERWRVWCTIVEAARSVRVARCYSEHFTTAEDVELHMFADASEQAYAAVGYWRIGHGDQFELAFVMGKTKCAPVKTLSIPRLELQAAVMAVRMLQTIREYHSIDMKRVVMWTDSRTVTQWLRSTTRRYKPYVAHRVAEITEHTDPGCWRWLPTDQNVADDATRVKPAPTFDSDSRWLRGPDFLLRDENTWPIEPATVNMDDNDPELIRERFVGSVQPGELVIMTNASTFTRLVRTMAWALRFAHNARAKRMEWQSRRGELNADEFRCSTDQVCRQVQREMFSEEYAALSSGKTIDRSSAIRALMPYLGDDNLIHLYGRTDAADPQHLPVTAQRPILLPQHHRFAELLVSHHHVRFGHQLDDGVICMVRQRYWIPSLRSVLQKVKRNCNVCKLRAARPRPPVAGQLPPDRMAAYEHPFAFTGLDFFGPVAVSVGRRREKRWVALFTCLTTRAVHLELAADLSTDACLLCLRNFFNLRGVPRRIRSDCGTNFVGADNVMRKTADFVDVQEVQKEMSTKGVQWWFNCPANPEAGGAWERLVQTTKRVLGVTLKEVAPRVETLRSLLIEAANILNSRPLTHIPVSVNDDAPITPNHFLLGRANSVAVPGPVEPRLLCDNKQWRIGEQLKNRFWAQFVRDFLPELTRRTRFYEDVPPLAIGDLVLVCETNQPRSEWARGRVESVMRGTDGRVRTASIRTKAGVMRRPVTKLAVLDVLGEPRDGRRHGARDVAS